MKKHRDLTKVIMEYIILNTCQNKMVWISNISITKEVVIKIGGHILKAKTCLKLEKIIASQKTTTN